MIQYVMIFTGSIDVTWVGCGTVWNTVYRKEN